MLIYDTYAAKLNRKTVQAMLPQLEDLLSIRSDSINVVDNIAILTQEAGDMIPSWEHPIYSEAKQVCFVDGRAFYDRFGSIRNQPEYNNLITRAKLEHRWATEPESFEFVINGCAAVFSQWVGSTFRQRYPMRESDIGFIQLLSAAFFMAQGHSGKDKRGLEDQLRFTVHQFGTRTLRLPAPFVDDTLELPAFKELLMAAGDNNLSVATFADLISKGVEVSIEDFSGQVLVSYLTPGAWVGLHDRKIAAVGIESPSSMVYMIYKAMGSTFYRNTKIGRAVDFMKRNAKLDTVQRFV